MIGWRIRQGYQLIDSRGNLVAGAGELVSADHPAVLATADMHALAVPVSDEPQAEPVEPVAVEASDADPGDEADFEV